MQSEADIQEKIGEAINATARCAALACNCGEGRRALWVVFDLAWCLDWPREHTIEQIAQAMEYWMHEVAEARAEGREIAE